jgi:hypothetical protein
MFTVAFDFLRLERLNHGSLSKFGGLGLFKVGFYIINKTRLSPFAIHRVYLGNMPSTNCLGGLRFEKPINISCSEYKLYSLF